jgi:hypothetical protein
MCFQPAEIQAARQLRDLGIHWEPQAGQYVLDESGVFDEPSPIQDNVHLIHDLRELLGQAGSIRDVKTSMCWLPTWREARQILRSMGLSDLRILAALVKSDALENGSELLVLYQLIAEQLRPRKSSPPAEDNQDFPAYTAPRRVLPTRRREMVAAFG